MRPRARVHVRTRGLAWVRWPPRWGGVRRLRGKHTSKSCSGLVSSRALCWVLTCTCGGESKCGSQCL